MRTLFLFSYSSLENAYKKHSVSSLESLLFCVQKSFNVLFYSLVGLAFLGSIGLLFLFLACALPGYK